MMKVLQMLLRTPGGKKAAAALWRTMNRGKGLARSTKRGIKRDLYPGYQDLMGKGPYRNVVKGQGKYKGANITAKEDAALQRMSSPDRADAWEKASRMSKSRSLSYRVNRHPGDPTGKKMKDSLPGVTYGAKGEIISGTRRGIKPGWTGRDKRIADKWHNEQLAKQYLNSSLRSGMSLRDQAIARDVLGKTEHMKRLRARDAMASRGRAQMQVNPKLKRMYDRIAEMSIKPVKATRRKPRSIYGRTKAAMKPAYNKMRNLRRRLREKGLV